MTKKYKLHCFNCGCQFNNKGEVERIRGEPYCFECAGNYYQDQEASDRERIEDERWARNHPGVDRDQYEIDEFHKRKYGEY